MDLCKFPWIHERSWKTFCWILKMKFGEISGGIRMKINICGNLWNNQCKCISRDPCTNFQRNHGKFYGGNLRGALVRGRHSGEILVYRCSWRDLWLNSRSVDANLTEKHHGCKILRETFGGVPGGIFIRTAKAMFGRIFGGILEEFLTKFVKKLLEELFQESKRVSLKKKIWWILEKWFGKFCNEFLEKKSWKIL